MDGWIRSDRNTREVGGSGNKATDMTSHLTEGFVFCLRHTLFQQYWYWTAAAQYWTTIKRDIHGLEVGETSLLQRT
jgi:hypothetical protein